MELAQIGYAEAYRLAEENVRVLTGAHLKGALGSVGLWQLLVAVAMDAPAAELVAMAVSIDVSPDDLHRCALTWNTNRRPQLLQLRCEQRIKLTPTTHLCCSGCFVAMAPSRASAASATRRLALLRRSKSRANPRNFQPVMPHHWLTFPEQVREGHQRETCAAL